jgi:hypothetical protein
MSKRVKIKTIPMKLAVNINGRLYNSLLTGFKSELDDILDDTLFNYLYDDLFEMLDNDTNMIILNGEPNMSILN